MPLNGKSDRLPTPISIGTSALSHRQDAYQTTIGSTWYKALLSYAATCWQLDRTEPLALSVLDGIESCYQNLQAGWPLRQASQRLTENLTHN